jgi:SAM-dependent methyltransferase
MSERAVAPQARSGDAPIEPIGDPAPTMRATYDQIAPSFAAANRAWPPEMLERYGPAFVAAARSAAAPAGGGPPRVIEVGCGPGRDMAWLESRGVVVVGVDLSRGMLQQARLRARGPLAQMDMRRIGVRPAALHGAWCNAALLHIPLDDAPYVLAQIAALLVSGGPLFVSLQGGAGETWEHAAYGHAVDRFFARYSADEVVAMLTDAGFVLQDQDQRPAGSRVWLRFLARRDV